MAGSSAAVSEEISSTSRVDDDSSVDPHSDKEVINRNTPDRTNTCDHTNAYQSPEGISQTVFCGGTKLYKQTKSFFWPGTSQKIKELTSEVERLNKTVKSLTSENSLQSQELERNTQSIADLKKNKRALQVKIRGAEDKSAKLESKIESLNRQLESLNKQNAVAKTRTKDLEDELEKTKRQQMDDENNSIHALPETGGTASIHSYNEEEIREMNFKQKKLTNQNSSLQNEIHKLKKKIASLECKRQDQNNETEEVRRREREKVDQARKLERDVEGYREENERLTLDNQDWQRQREDLKKRNIELEARISSMAKDIIELKHQVSAQQTSSATRETSLTESHRQHMTQLREQHKSDLEEKERRFAAEREQLQSQLEMFLRNLNDDNRLERDTLRTAMQQMTETNMAINRILNAAFQAYQGRRYGRGATVREIKDDF